MLTLILAVWLVPAVAMTAFCLYGQHSRKPKALLNLVWWSLTWPAWVFYVAVLNLLGFNR